MKKFYITTSIAYTNAPPHIGFALELIQADVLARYHRLLNEDVFFLTGTDNHGLKNLRAAEKVGLKPEEFTNKISEKFKSLAKILNISNNDFIKTTDKKRHKPAVEKFWKKLEKSGDIYKKKYKGFYCAGCEAFVTKKDLVNNKCPNHQKKPEIVEEENYFFRLSRYLSRIEELIRKDEIRIIPRTRKNEILGFIQQELEDVSFSRAKEKYWGFSAPGDESQIIYVWCDALPNYVSAIGYAEESEKFKKYWPADVHCIGKDIIKFHAIFWPAMLLSAGLKLPKTIFVHGFISVDGRKMSKSLGNVIDPFELVKKYGTDAVRYYLLREISPFEDGDFTYQKFEARYNADLASGIGNLVARVRTMAEKLKAQNSPKESLWLPTGQAKLAEGVPLSAEPYGTGKTTTQNSKIKEEIKKTRKNYQKALDNFKFNETLKIIWNLIGFSDRYIEKEKPWQSRKNSPEVISDLLIILDDIAELLKPFLPETAEKISKEIERDQQGRFRNKKGRPLFPRI